MFLPLQATKRDIVPLSTICLKESATDLPEDQYRESKIKMKDTTNVKCPNSVGVRREQDLSRETKVERLKDIKVNY